jgi:MoaA/NifB/PqqE/SkfB family radical SAM enzyme
MESLGHKLGRFVLHSIGDSALYLARKDLWFHRKRFKQVADKMYDINPKFSTRVVFKYCLRQPIMTKKRKDFKEKHGFRPPISMIVNPGDYCQLKCKKCANEEEKKGKKNVPTYSALKRIALEMQNIGARHIILMGGDPLHPTSKESVSNLLDNFPNMMFTMFTNGIGLDKDFANLIYERANCSILLSCDGLREVSDTRRGKGSFEGVERASSILHERKVPYGISITVMNYNLDHLGNKEFVKYFEKKGAVAGFFVPFMPLDGAYKESMPTKKQREQFSEKLKELEKEVNMALFSYNDLTNLSVCRAGTKHMYVNSRGDVSPCFAITYKTGNIFENSLEEIVTTPFAREFREIHKDVEKGCVAMKAPIEIIELANKHVVKSSCSYIQNYADIHEELVGEYL